MECQSASVRVHSEYFNHTLDDYLTALRGKKVPLSIDEVLYIIKSVVSALTALRSTEGVIQKCAFGKWNLTQEMFSSQWKDRYFSVPSTSFTDQQFPAK